MPTSPPRIPIVVLAGQSNANSVQLGTEIFRQVVQNGGMMVHAAFNGSALSERLNTGSGNWNAATATTPMGSNLAALCCWCGAVQCRGTLLAPKRRSR